MSVCSWPAVYLLLPIPSLTSRCLRFRAWLNSAMTATTLILAVIIHSLVFCSHGSDASTIGSSAHSAAASVWEAEIIRERSSHGDRRRAELLVRRGIPAGQRGRPLGHWTSLRSEGDKATDRGLVCSEDIVATTDEALYRVRGGGFGHGLSNSDRAHGSRSTCGGHDDCDIDQGELDLTAKFRASKNDRDRDCKFIVVTGGVLSGIGKGVTASSIGVLCKMMGLRPTAIKIDPYLNVDAGTMSPFEHGEVFVLDDGGETDLDLGNYERFMGVNLKNESNLTTGKIYQHVIQKERRGDYLGKTVQVVPHITDAIQEWIADVSKKPVDDSEEKPDVCIIELGGTLGDIESMPFVEALRQLQRRVGYKNCCFVHVSLVPELGSPGEQKTKPTQHSVKQMRALGLAPDFLMCRGANPIVEGARQKLSMFCQVPPERVISVHDVSNIYHVTPLLLGQNFPALLAQRLRMGPRHAPAEAAEALPVKLNRTSLERWESLARRLDEVSDEVVIGIVGKYTDLHDTYLSVVKALLHASLQCERRLKIKWVESAALDKAKQPKDPTKYQKAWDDLKSCHGVLVPGGFGSRGLEGKIKAITHARECRVPFLGVCLGMQAAVIEFARSKLGREKANSAEFAEGLASEDEVVMFMPEGDRSKMGGTMRLGSRVTVLRPRSRAFDLYGGEGDIALEVHERHRHRYEVNPSVVAELEAAGMKFVGRNTDGTGERMEVLELEDKSHPYFMGAQYHPEFKSRPGRPSPLFTGLLMAAAQYADQVAGPIRDRDTASSSSTSSNQSQSAPR